MIAALTGIVLAAPVSTSAAEPVPVPRTEMQQDLAAQVHLRLRNRLPEIADAVHIDSQSGRVTLRGTVARYQQKIIAGDVAEEVRGVLAVVNDLQVAPSAPIDSDVAGSVQWILNKDPATSALGVRATAENGTVTLRGKVQTFAQKKIAAWVAMDRAGIRDLRNEIEVVPEARPDEEILRELESYFAESPHFRNNEIHVLVNHGRVKLIGQVDTVLEKTWLQEDSWVRGVRDVDSTEVTIAPRDALAGAHYGPGRSDDDTRQAVLRAFSYDPRTRSADIQAAAKNHVVTLDGTVSNRKARQVAVRLASDTAGVVSVVDHLRVAEAEPRSDAELRQDLEKSLHSSSALANIKLTVTGGRAVLSGEVESPFEKWLAEDLADRTAGVKEIDNRLTVRNRTTTVPERYYFYPRPNSEYPRINSPQRGQAVSDQKIEAAIQAELKANPVTRASLVQVSVSRQAATLSGHVASETERAAVEEAAYLSGASEVHDHLEIDAPGPLAP